MNMATRFAWLPALLLAACSSAQDAALQGYAEAEFVRVAAPFAGALVKIDVQRGSRVEPGSPLFALEAENETAARREAEDRLRRAQAQLENLRKGRRPTEIDAVRAQLAQAQAASALSALELKRQTDLVSRGFVSRQQLDEARSAVERDTARVEELKAQLATAQLPARADEIRAAQAEVSAAQATADQAEWRLRQKTSASTVSGVVTDVYFVKGEWVGAGQPVVSLLPPENVKARFYVSQASLGAVSVGQAVTLRCDGCSDPIRATVSWISPQAEFTPPVIYSKESRAKLVYLVEARPLPADATRLKPGQPLDVVLH